MTTLHPAMEAAAFGVLEAARDAGTWDELPVIVVVVDDGDGIGVAPVFIPPNFWIDNHPAYVLNTMAKTMDELGGGILSADTGTPIDSVIGVMMINEAHMVEAANTPDERRDLRVFRRERHLEEHPDAQECRIVTAVDRALTVGVARHVRDQPIDADIAYDAEGRVTQAMVRFTTSLLTSTIAREHYTTPDTPQG